MNTNINLLLRKDDELLKRLKRTRALNILAVMLLFGIGVVSLLVFILIQIIDPSLVKKEQDDILIKISQFQDKQAKLFVLNNRIDNVAEILKERKDLSEAANALLTRTENNLTIENLEIDDKVVIMTASSTSLSDIGEFINNLADMVRKKEIISSLTLNTLVFDGNSNNYSVSIKAGL